MKCVDCICAIKIMPKGVWCVRFKGVPTKEMVEKCKDFVDKSKFPELSP
jgi:hypothetical protein